MYQFFWDIPYPVILEKTYVPFFFLGGYPISSDFRENLCTGFFSGYPIYQHFRKKLCTVFFSGISDIPKCQKIIFIYAFLGTFASQKVSSHEYFQRVPFVNYEKCLSIFLTIIFTKKCTSKINILKQRHVMQTRIQKVIQESY